MVERDNELTLVLPGRTLRLPLAAREAVDALLDSGLPIRVGDLPAVSESEALALSRDLIRAGVVVSRTHVRLLMRRPTRARSAERAPVLIRRRGAGGRALCHRIPGRGLPARRAAWRVGPAGAHRVAARYGGRSPARRAGDRSVASRRADQAPRTESSRPAAELGARRLDAGSRDDRVGIVHRGDELLDLPLDGSAGEGSSDACYLGAHTGATTRAAPCGAGPSRPRSPGRARQPRGSARTSAEIASRRTSSFCRRASITDG